MLTEKPGLASHPAGQPGCDQPDCSEALLEGRITPDHTLHVPMKDVELREEADQGFVQQLIAICLVEASRIYSSDVRCMRGVEVGVSFSPAGLIFDSGFDLVMVDLHAVIDRFSRLAG